MRRWVEVLVFVLACTLALLATVPGWAGHMGSGLPDHWDPPLHAWKLLWNGRHILDGRFFWPPCQANAFYPHADTLCFDDLFWPQSFVAAGVLAMGLGPLFAYNLTLLFMWVLSGTGCFLLLRSLGCGALAAGTGGLLFTLLPYKLSYYLEFNMQLDFGLVFVVYFLWRLYRRPSWSAALGLAAAFWFQAISALYYAVIAATTLPLMLPSLWRHLRRRGTLAAFLGFAAVAAVAAAVGCAVFLWPYWELYHADHLQRHLSETMTHRADLLAYLQPIRSRLTGIAGFSPLGLKGTWQSLPHSSHTASCNEGLLVFLPPKFLLEESFLSFDLLSNLKFFINISTKY